MTEKNKVLIPVHPHSLWVETCTSLAKMQGLRELGIHVSMTGPFSDTLTAQQEERLLEPLNSVKAPVKFRLEVSWTAISIDERQAQYQFSIQRNTKKPESSFLATHSHSPGDFMMMANATYKSKLIRKFRRRGERLKRKAKIV